MRINWRKSSYSGGSTDEMCVEVGELVSGVGVSAVVAVRDSKDPDGPVLLLTRAALRTTVQSTADTY